MLIATPDTIWSPLIVTLRKAWMRAIRAPAATAMSTPSQTLPVKKAPTTPAKAPVSIMPSRPMFTTPERSEKMPPMAVKTRGVARRTAAAKNAAVKNSINPSSTDRLLSFQHGPQARQEHAGDHQDEGETLHDLRQGYRKSFRALDGVETTPHP